MGSISPDSLGRRGTPLPADDPVRDLGGEEEYRAVQQGEHQQGA